MTEHRFRRWRFQASRRSGLHGGIRTLCSNDLAPVPYRYTGLCLQKKDELLWWPQEKTWKGGCRGEGVLLVMPGTGVDPCVSNVIQGRNRCLGMLPCRRLILRAKGLRVPVLPLFTTLKNNLGRHPRSQGPFSKRKIRCSHKCHIASFAFIRLIPEKWTGLLHLVYRWSYRYSMGACHPSPAM